MAKENPIQGGAEVYPSPTPDKVGPIAGNVDPAPSTKAVEVKIDLLSPEEHAEALKAVKTVQRTARVNGEPESFQLFHWQHAAAEALHGWKDHAHHEAKPIQLSRADYEKALIAASHPITRALDADGKPTGDPIDSHEAAAKGVPTFTDYEPHKPALSQHKGRG